jgi:outer membrane protein with beta-barrel domain
MRHHSVVLAAALLATAVAGAPRAHADDLDLRLGGFAPRADSNLFRDDSELYTVSNHDWRGFSGGAAYYFRLRRGLSLGLSLDGYGQTIDTIYRDFEHSNGANIPQSLKLTVVPLGVSLRFAPGRPNQVTPFMTVGADLFFYRYEEFGEFIDFQDPTLPILPDHFISSGTEFGFHVSGGLRVPINHDFGVVGEVRYQFAHEDRLGEDFLPQPGQLPLQLDLSGFTATVGVNIRF